MGESQSLTENRLFPFPSDALSKSRMMLGYGRHRPQPDIGLRDVGVLPA